MANVGNANIDITADSGAARTEVSAKYCLHCFWCSRRISGI
jgi:hypothetical protein